MRITLLVCAFVAIPVLTACVATPDYQKIVTKDEYLTAVSGRSLNLGGASSSITHADGTMTGNSGGREIKGQWTWEDGKFCREGTIGSDAIDRDCQIMEIAGDKLRVTRGDGTQSIFDLK